MEEDKEKFELKDDTNVYKITLKKFICVFLIIVIVLVLAIYCIFKSYYENKQINNNNVELEQVIENLENRVNQEKNEEEFEENVDYDYSDYLSNDVIENYEEDYSEEYNIEDEYRLNTEFATEFIYGIMSNPLYTISNGFSGYKILKNSEKQADGSYNLKIKFDDLSEMIYFAGLHPSCLKSNEVLKNNINIISEEQINIKDTNVEYYYLATLLSFDEIGDKEYNGYISIEEYDETGEYCEFKYAEVNVKFNSNALVTSIDLKDVSKETIPEELLLDDYYEEDYDTYSYSDYISK